MQGLLLAIDIEKNGYSFYTEAAKQTEDPRGCAMFTRLAQDETRHLEWLTKHKESLERSGQWEKTEQLKAIPSLAHRVFPQFSGKPTTKKDKTRELEALRRGIQAEKDSIALYREMTEKIEDPSAKATFNRLAKEEENHFYLLQAEHDYLSRSGFFFDMPEFDLEGLE